MTRAEGRVKIFVAVLLSLEDVFKVMGNNVVRVMSRENCRAYESFSGTNRLGARGIER